MRTPPREPRIIWNSRHLPIPVDAFQAGPVPASDGNTRVRELPGLELWVTVTPSLPLETISSLCSRPGAAVLRVNSSKFAGHADLAQFLRRCVAVRARTPRIRICLDLGAEKIRIRGLKSVSGRESIDLFRHERIALVDAARVAEALDRAGRSTAKVVPITTAPARLPVDVGDLVFISDGWVQLRVAGRDGEVLWCEALHDGRTFEGRGVDVPGIYDRIQPVRDDEVRTVLAVHGELEGTDLVALSFVNGGDEVSAFRERLSRAGVELPVVAKIETRTGVEHARGIAEAADCMMVARGDLAVQLAPEGIDMLAVEDRLRSVCRDVRRPCVIATRVADSLEKGTSTLADHERFRLYHELSTGPPLALLLAGETMDPERALANYDIVAATIAELAGEFPAWSLPRA